MELSVFLLHYSLGLRSDRANPNSLWERTTQSHDCHEVWFHRGLSLEASFLGCPLSSWQFPLVKCLPSAQVVSQGPGIESLASSSPQGACRGRHCLCRQTTWSSWLGQPSPPIYDCQEQDCSLTLLGLSTHCKESGHGPEEI